ncbi:MAG: DUF4386 domain-containing protein [Spirochaetes bacterium]|nr:DUF4386 domain-containing protein [Spirochaetota bacterium]
MNTYKNAARIAGTLFIITMIAGGINSYLVDPILLSPLVNVFPNRLQVISGAFLMLVMSVGIVGIAVAFFPVVKKHNESIAVTYLSFRIIECVLLVAGVIVSLFLVTLSREYIKAGAPEASYFQTLGVLAMKVRYYAYQIAMIILGVGSLMLFYLFYQSKLIPRFISAWGLAGYALLLASAVLDIFGIIDTIQGKGIIMYVPGGVFELLLLPAWLIVKGFNPSATVSGPPV